MMAVLMYVAVPAVHSIQHEVKAVPTHMVVWYKTVPTYLAIPTVHSPQYKTMAAPTHVTVLTVHGLQYKAMAVPMHMTVPIVRSICDRLCENRPCSHLVVIRETLV